MLDLCKLSQITGTQLMVHALLQSIVQMVQLVSGFGDCRSYGESLRERALEHRPAVDCHERGCQEEDPIVEATKVSQ